jgi:hypothetical protein
MVQDFKSFMINWGLFDYLSSLAKIKDQLPLGKPKPLVVAAVPAFNEEYNIAIGVGGAETC